jgi:hypothetical protein
MSAFSLVIPGAVGLISLAASGHAFAGDRLVATAPTTTEVAPAPAKQARQLPPDIQQDPGARVLRLQQMRRPIIQKIKSLPEARYRQVIRPSLARQLEQMGFDAQDVAYFLTDLDRSRGGR